MVSQPSSFRMVKGFMDVVTPSPVSHVLEFHSNSPVLSKTIYFDKNVPGIRALKMFSIYLCIYFCLKTSRTMLIVKVSVLQSTVKGY